MCRTASIPPRERRLRRKICSEINGCYREAFNRRSDSIIHVFLLSIFRGEPLINNLDSCSLILKDVWLYNKVGSGAFYVFPSQCQILLGNRAFICNSVHKSRRPRRRRRSCSVSVTSHSPSRTCTSFTFLFFSFLCRPPGVVGPAGVQRRRRLLPRHVHVQQQHRGLPGERAHRHPSQPARQHGRDVSFSGSEAAEGKLL